VRAFRSVLHNYCDHERRLNHYFMRPFEILDTSALVNALAEYTTKYTKLLTEGGRKKDIFNCRETMQSLIAEIELRKALKNMNNPPEQTEGRIST
jgi:hypothetical protein